MKKYSVSISKYGADNHVATRFENLVGELVDTDIQTFGIRWPGFKYLKWHPKSHVSVIQTTCAIEPNCPAFRTTDGRCANLCHPDCVFRDAPA